MGHMPSIAVRSNIYVCLCGVFLTVCRGGADGTDTRLGRDSFALLLFEAR